MGKVEWEVSRILSPSAIRYPYPAIDRQLPIPRSPFPI